jgi:hypothetical protein
MTARSLALGVLAAVLAGGAAAAPRDAERAPNVVERPSKPTGPIAVEYRLGGTTAVGVPLTIAVTARAVGAAALAIEATPTDPRALQVSAPVLAGTEAGRFEWTISVVPLAADAGFVNVLVTGTIDGVEQARSVVIPLRLAATPAEGAPGEDSGENLIALPAEEPR